jgi:hypothetical protein
MKKQIRLLLVLVGSVVLCSFQQKPRIVNIVNFIRQTEPRIAEITDDVLYQTVASQVACLRQNHLKATFLLQYDALINSKYQKLLKELPANNEIGGWWEVTQPHVKAAGLKWRGRYPWDWHANVGFSTGYTPAERERLVDVYMAKFKEIFGKYPSSVGSWFIDAHTLAYMYEKYHIVASCNCRDQVGTDGYTMWGGYWGQAYYPSRKNAYMPAQTAVGQIPVPIFRMLGSDPIYQYDSGIGGVSQSVATLEPVYGSCGASRQWVDWFAKSMFENPCLGFTYTQAGQENSFTWNAMHTGYEMQMPIFAKLMREGKIQVQTLTETGKWYKSCYSVTPPTALSALSDFREKNRKTVWYDSRYYRVNLLWEGDTFYIRDIHLFNENYSSDYLYKAGTSTQCLYTTLPFVDGCLWSSDKLFAGLRFYAIDERGKMTEMKWGTPRLISKGKSFKVECPICESHVSFTILFKEDRMEITCNDQSKRFVWCMRLKALRQNMPLPFTIISHNRIDASQRGFDYHVVCKQGNLTDCRKNGDDDIFEITPEMQKVILDFKSL